MKVELRVNSATAARMRQQEQNTEENKVVLHTRQESMRNRKRRNLDIWERMKDYSRVERDVSYQPRKRKEPQRAFVDSESDCLSEEVTVRRYGEKARRVAKQGSPTKRSGSTDTLKSVVPTAVIDMGERSGGCPDWADDLGDNLDAAREIFDMTLIHSRCTEWLRPRMKKRNGNDLSKTLVDIFVVSITDESTYKSSSDLDEVVEIALEPSAVEEGFPNIQAEAKQFIFKTREEARLHTLGRGKGRPRGQ